MRRLTSSDWENTSKPAIRAVPPLAGMKQDRIFIVVDLPAPLGPRKPTICPFSTLKVTSATTRSIPSPRTGGGAGRRVLHLPHEVPGHPLGGLPPADLRRALHDHRALPGGRVDLAGRGRRWMTHS